MLRHIFGLAALVASLSAPIGAQAQLTAEPLPGDPRLVEFRFDANNSYRVFTKPLTVTHVVLEADERVKYLALGDTDSWLTSKKDNHLFIKPKRERLTTSGTLLTNKREYQFTLISTDPNGRWYQRVSFQYPNQMAMAVFDEDVNEILGEQAQTGTTVPVPPRAVTGSLPGSVAAGVADSTAGQSGAVDLARLNFAYEMVGEANFKPITIYDNGQQTHIKLPPDASVPALFTIVDGEVEMIDYTHSPPDVLVIPRVIGAGLLKIGPREVRFYNLNKMRKTWSGSYVERSK